MAEDIIIDVKNVWKRYGLPPILPWKKRRFHESDFALKDITFQVRRGGSLGILGRNGAGKSTLLKLLAGVTPPDKGSIDIRGSIFPMIELNTGISMELTGRENIALLATIMGFNDREIRRLEPEVIDFSELEDWIDRPVWQYSSGMLARLGFSIAVHTHTDILLVDEVLSVGDVYFQRKAHKKMRELISSGITFIYVTQNAFEVERLCENGLVLSKGKSLFYGISAEAKNIYLGSPQQSLSGHKIKIYRELVGNEDVTLENIYFLDNENNGIDSFHTHDDIVIKILCTAHKDLTEFRITIRFYDKDKTFITNISPAQEWYPTKIKKGRFAI